MASKKVNLIISLKDNVSAGLKKIGGGVKVLGTGFRLMAKVAAVSFAAVGAAAAVVGRTIKKSFEFETAKVQLKSLLGSTEAAIERFNELRDFAASTPFQLPELLDASKKLTVFTEGVLGSAKSLRVIGDAAAAVGTPIQEVSFWVGRAYSMLKSGKPFGEAAMRLQEMGILTPKVRDEMEKLQKSGASFETIWGKMNGEMGRFSGSMEELSSTGAGKWSTLMDNMGIASAEFGDELLGLSKETIGDLTKAIQGLVKDGSIKRWAKQTATAVDGIRKVVGPVIDHFTKLIKKYNDLGRFVGAFAESLKSGSGFKEAIKDANDYVEATNNNIEAQKKLAAETERVNKLVADKEKAQKTEDERWNKMLSEQRDLDVQSGLTSGWSPGAGKGGGAADTAASPVAKVVKSSGGGGGGGASDASGFAEMAKKMMDAGTSSHLALRATTQAAELEAEGRHRGIEGIGKMAEEMLRAGESIAVVRHDLEKVMQAGEAGADATKKKDTTADLIAESNELARQQLAITTERLGGVKP